MAIAMEEALGLVQELRIELPLLHLLALEVMSLIQLTTHQGLWIFTLELILLRMI